MRVVFDRVVAEDFMSFSSLDFRIPKTGLWMVYGEVGGVNSGSNGAGKSALFETIVWALYGRTLRGGKADDVIRNGATTTRVTLDFFVDEQPYRIERTRTVQGGHHVAIFVCEEDNLRNISGSGVADTNNKIVSVIGGTTFDVFRNTVCFGQGLPYRFIQATDAEKKRIFDEILALDWMSKAKERTSELLRHYEQESSRINFDLSVLKSDLEETLGEIHKLIVGDAVDAEDPAKIFKDFRYALKEKESLIEELKQIERDIKRLRRERRDLENQVKRLESQLGAIVRKLAVKREALRTADKALDEVENAISKLSSAKQCPLCFTVLSEKEKNRLLTDYQRRRADLIEEARVNSDVIRLYERSVAELRGRISRVESRISAVQSELERLEGDRKTGQDELTWLSSRISRLKTELKFLTSEKKREEEKLESLERKVVELNRDISIKTKRKAEIDIALEVLRFWDSSFGSRGLKTLVLETVLPELNRIVALYLDAVGMSNSKLAFSSQSVVSRGLSERIGIHITEGDFTRSYETLSGGEKRRYDFVLLLALQEFISRVNNVDFSIQVFDEVCESLDDNGIEKVVALLDNVSSVSGRAIFVISHNELAQSLGEILRVVKSGGVSRLVYN